MKIKFLKNWYKQPEFWIFFTIAFNCVYKSFINFLYAPSFIAYLSDIICAILFVAICMYRERLFSKSFLPPLLVFIVLVISTIFGYVVNIYSPMIYIWGFRTLFRYHIFFFACILFLNIGTVYKLMKFLYVILIVNAVFSTIEYYLGYNFNSISGLYTAGKESFGGNASLNVLICIVCAYALSLYFEKKCSLIYMLTPLLLSVYMAAIGEMKAVFFELAIIAVMCSLLTKFSFKKLFSAIIIFIVIIIGVNLYGQYYAGKNEDFFSMEGILSYLGADGSTYGKNVILNRTTVLPYMFIVHLTSIAQKLFGLGLGYADNVSLDIFSSGFYESNSNLGYHYFSVSLELTNIGIIGLILYLLFFAIAFIFARKTIKLTPENKPLLVCVQVMAIFSFFFVFYNQALILDTAAYMYYFILSIPFILMYRSGVKKIA